MSGDVLRFNPALQMAKMVYLISDGVYTKIGCSGDVRQRLKSMQTHNALPLRLLMCFPGGRDLESQLHDQFSAKRKQGEWFNLAPADWQSILTAYACDVTAWVDEDLKSKLGCAKLRSHVYFGMSRNDMVRHLDETESRLLAHIHEHLNRIRDLNQQNDRYWMLAAGFVRATQCFVWMFGPGAMTKATLKDYQHLEDVLYRVMSSEHEVTEEMIKDFSKDG